MSDPSPVIALTLGDPAGVGPEVVLKALADPQVLSQARWLIVGDASVIETAELRTNNTLPGEPAVKVIDCNVLQKRKVTPGKLDATYGAAALEFVRTAVQLCRSGEAGAMVTGPLNKEAVALNKVHFTGHTEYIGDLCGASQSRMLLVNDRLRVLHVTTHCSLQEACQITQDRVLQTLRLGHESLQLLGVNDRRIAVCGLNPHAGENGLFGPEDDAVIRPAVEAARSEGIDCHGPLPADTLFHKAFHGDFELAVAMYHDQGHVPMKLIDFDNTVNISVGLPIIRTSVDHGTAFDIAGQNRASPNSMKAAMRLAVTMVRNRKRHDAGQLHRSG